MSRPKSDLSSRRMRSLIQAALVELVQLKGFDAIRVQQIADQAMIDRSTFYRHYRDKYAVVEDIFKSAVNELSGEIGDSLTFGSVADLTAAQADEQAHAGWIRLFSHFSANSRVYSALLGSEGSAWFQARMRLNFVKLFEKNIRGARSPEDDRVIPIEVIRHYMASALVGFIQLWLEGGTKESAKQMADWIRVIAYRGYMAPLVGLRASEMGSRRHMHEEESGHRSPS